MTDELKPPEPPAAHSQPPRSGPKFDPTINVPTIITILTASVSSVAFVVGLYNNLNARVDKNAAELSYVQRDVEGLRASQREMDARFSQAIRELQQQNREDFNSVRGILNQLLVASGAIRHPETADARSWTK